MMVTAQNTLPRTSQQIAAVELRNAIVRGDLAPGEKIRQDAAAKGMGISVIPVREALKALAGEGFVVYKPQRGYFVAELTVETLNSLEEARDLVEGAAEKSAVRRITPAGLQLVRSAMGEHEVAMAGGEIMSINRANRRFHEAILAPGENEFIMRFVRQAWDALEPYRGLVYRRLSTGRPEHAPDILAEHREIVDALAAGSRREALRALQHHRRHSDDLLRHYVETIGK
jgi:DNA-binding GntR family transcriptional regulator